MASLSRRERKEVRAEIARALRPDVKLYQADLAGAYVTSTSAGAGTDLLAGIVPGTGEGNRLGDSIRVRRVELWVHWQCPIRPWVDDCVAGDLFWRSTVPVGGTMPGSAAAFYDAALAAGALYLRGPAPPLLESGERGWNFRALEKHKLQSMAVLDSMGYRRAAGIQGDIGYPNGAEVGLTTGGAGPYNSTSFSYCQLNNMVGGVADPGNVVRPSLGPKHVVKKYTMSWPGKGLKVQYTNAGLGTIDENHIVYIPCSTIIPGSANSQCPYVRASLRVWFTEND